MNDLEERDLIWEANEIDRGLDFTNVVFGALLSAYMGVEMARGDFSRAELFNVAFIASMLTLAFSSYRNAWHILSGTMRGPMAWNIIAIVGACIAMGATIPKTRLDLEVFLFIFGGWLVTSLLLVGGYVIKNAWGKG